jgi:hypothetical protein
MTNLTRLATTLPREAGIGKAEKVSRLTAHHPILHFPGFPGGSIKYGRAM